MRSTYVDAGSLNERLTVLELREGPESAYTWTEARRTWGAAEPSAKRNVWSVHGIGAAGVTFTIRRQPLALDNAILWNGQHCFLLGMIGFETCFRLPFSSRRLPSWRIQIASC